MSDQTKYFINLTNGIEALNFFNFDEINFIRIQSTTLERNNWERLFLELDNNFLMWLSVGISCQVIDFGTNRELSKTIYMGIPIIQYCLNRFWFNIQPDFICINKSGENHISYVEREIYLPYFKNPTQLTMDPKIKIANKYNYFNRFTSINKHQEIFLTGKSYSTKHDSNVEYYKSIIVSMLLEV